MYKYIYFYLPVLGYISSALVGPCWWRQEENVISGIFKNLKTFQLHNNFEKCYLRDNYNHCIHFRGVNLQLYGLTKCITCCSGGPMAVVASHH